VYYPHIPRGEDRLELTLARRLTLDLGRFLEIYGAGWRECPPDWDEYLRWENLEKYLARGEQTPWYIAGEHPVLMLQINGGIGTVARPVGRWHGVAELAYEPADNTILTGAIDQNKEAVAQILGKRRSEFRYCLLCRASTPPERMSRSECMGCSAKWLGVRY